MTWQALNPRNTRRIERDTGLPMHKVYSHGGYVHEFVTRGHLHGAYSLKTRTWAVNLGQPSSHFSSCPHGEPPPLTPAERHALADSGTSDAYAAVCAATQEWDIDYIRTQAGMPGAAPMRRRRRRPRPSLMPPRRSEPLPPFDPAEFIRQQWATIERPPRPPQAGQEG